MIDTDILSQPRVVEFTLARSVNASLDVFCFSAGLDTPSWIDGLKKTFEEGHRIRHLDLCLGTPACWEVLKWPSIGSKHPEFSRLEHAEICILWHPNRESPYPGREEPTPSSDVG